MSWATLVAEQKNEVSMLQTRRTWKANPQQKCIYRRFLLNHNFLPWFASLIVEMRIWITLIWRWFPSPIWQCHSSWGPFHSFPTVRPQIIAGAIEEYISISLVHLWSKCSFMVIKFWPANHSSDWRFTIYFRKMPQRTFGLFHIQLEELPSHS